MPCLVRDALLTHSHSYSISSGSSCMEHAIHLGAGHFISGVGPTSSSKVIKKVKALFRKACAGEDEDPADLDQLDSELVATFEEGGEDDGGGESEGDNEFDVADTVGKALALIKQVLPLLFCSSINI